MWSCEFWRMRNESTRQLRKKRDHRQWRCICRMLGWRSLKGTVCGATFEIKSNFCNSWSCKVVLSYFSTLRSSQCRPILHSKIWTNAGSLWGKAKSMQANRQFDFFWLASSIIQLHAVTRSIFSSTHQPPSLFDLFAPRVRRARKKGQEFLQLWNIKYLTHLGTKSQTNMRDRC